LIFPSSIKVTIILAITVLIVLTGCGNDYQSAVEVQKKENISQIDMDSFSQLLDNDQIESVVVYPAETKAILTTKDNDKYIVSYPSDYHFGEKMVENGIYFTVESPVD
jgi:ATP-dependent Zn protease